MTKKRIALIRYSPDYFMPFGRGLEAAGFEVYWINALKSDARALIQAEVSTSQWLDTTEDFDPDAMPLSECRARLGALERAVEGPRVYDIILMDRHLRKKSTEFAIRYLAHIERVVTEYLTRNRIGLVSSGRDSALQLLTMLVCRRLGIPWVVPTRARIPQELYGFCSRHDTEGLIRFRNVTPEDHAWAAAFLDQYKNKALRPALKKSARGFLDVLQLLPAHARVFAYELGKSLIDKGNDYARYTIPTLVAMYLRRRLNMLTYKLAPPYQTPGAAPFGLYALHTQPESSIDVVGSYYSDQIGLVRTIARSMPATHELYVKIHPSDVDGKTTGFYRELRDIPGVRLIGHQIDARELLSRVSIVFALSGTIAYEAGLLGRPVITFARNYFNALPTIRHCATPAELSALIDAMLDQPAPENLQELLTEFLAELRVCCLDGEVNRTYGTSTSALKESDLDTLRQAYSALAQQLACG